MASKLLHDGPRRAAVAPLDSATPELQKPNDSKSNPDSDPRPRTRRSSLRRTKNSTDQLRKRARGGSDSTIGADGQHAVREGRQFTVASIGNNGIIYLRPLVRPGSRRPDPPLSPFAFPSTTTADRPTTAKGSQQPGITKRESFFSALRTTPSPSTLVEAARKNLAIDHGQSQPSTRPQSKRPSKARSFSFATADSLHPAQTWDPGSFRVVIDRQFSAATRPRTADAKSPVLEVSIPHYRLGTPHFSAKGTAVLRSSAYTGASGTEDMRSSVISVVEQSKVFPLQGGVGRKSILSRRHSETFQRPNHLRRGTAERTTKFHSLLPSTPPSPLKPPITADIYEPLTTAPDDPSVVRFSPTNGEIAAATPARLIAHITSPTFVDYELLSDFFLTFRSFLSTGELVEYLVARLQWAVNRSDDFGRIVRVRTFVALRHWILNYFVDDFLPSLQLRLQFCTLVNQLYRNLQARADHGGGDLKIVGELKKCWRRTCVLYWNESEATMADSSESEILPGGPDESTDAMAASAQSGQQVQGSIGRPPLAAHVGTAAVPSGNQQPGWSTMAPHAAQSSFTRELYSAQFQKQSNKFRASEQSMQVRSCSIPMLTSHRGDTNAARNVFPHPITDSPQHQVQHTTPAKRVASGHGHKRSGSFSDALRDHRTPLSQPKVSASDVPLSVHPFSGSLIRGAVFEPAPPDVDIAFSEDGDRKKSQLDLSLGERAGWSVDSLRTGPTSSQGMKKILGSVRRALSSRQPSSSVYGAGGNGEPAAASRSSEFHSRPSKARSSEGVHKKVRSRPPTRIDVLAAEAAEAFRKAVLAAIEKERGATAAALVSTTSVMDGGKQPSVDTKTKLQSPSGRLISNVTMGSRSIVIVDDTGPPKELLMSGAFRTTDWNARFPPGKSRLSQCPPEQTNPIGNAAVGGEGHLPHSGRGTTDQMPGNNQHAGPESYAGDAGKGSSDRSITQSAYVKRPPALRRSRSARSGPPTSNSLRRFASFQSGMGRAAPSQHTEGSSFSYIYSTTTPSEDASEPSEVESHPLRRLRRRPGGDLRAFENVHDLECQRPHSTGSLSNRSHSISNSVAFTSVDVTGGTFDTKPTTNFADEASRETKSETSRILRKPYSLVQTHSSQPNLRPSFEAEVAKLAALPDDEDDGGIESALLKLEGRYEKRSPEELPRSPFEDPSDSNDTSSTRTHREQKAVLTNAPRSPESGRAAVDPTQTYNTQAAPITPGDKQIPRAEVRPGPRAITTVRSVAGSEDSYSSVPLLQRGLSDAYTRKRGKGPAEYNKGASNFGMPSSPPPSSRGKAPSTVNGKSPQSPVARMGEPETMLKLPHNRAPPRMSVGGGSFLLDDNQSLSDLSSELSTELLDTSENDSHEVMSFFDDEDAGDSQPENEILSHPLRHPPTPPLSEKSLRKPPALDDSSFQQRLPTPGQTPVASAPIHLHTRSSFPLSPPAIEMADLNGSHISRANHLPFILAYDSEVLAEQFTIVEKDALDEIDWKELIELRWKQSANVTTCWVNYLQTEEPRGVDIVIARFNLMVKWVVSECVLTENLEERARCIVKYIHIAAHARRLRNYATMYQITVALVSSDCSRLKQTWDLVPAAEMQTMKELEAVIQPLRNFQNLRIEMETAPVEDGCIPFIGIYTHDLIYNAQKPALIKNSASGDEPMVNFERHRTAATIVKNLLRLLEASSKYRFKPQPDIISRCLWMVALPDKEITALSRKLAFGTA